jgi:hypothetical protein
VVLALVATCLGSLAVAQQPPTAAGKDRPRRMAIRAGKLLDARMKGGEVVKNDLAPSH